MKLKKSIAVGCIVFVALAAWFSINPPGRFGLCGFAYTTYSGIPRPLSDLQVRSDGKVRTVDKTHDLKLEHIEWLLEPKPEVLIIAIGWDGVTRTDKNIDNIQGCEIKILRTGDAVKLFNRMKREKKQVSIHVHSTC